MVILTRSRHLRKSRPRRKPRRPTGGRSATSRNRRVRTPGERCAATVRRRKRRPRRRRPSRKPNPPRAPQSKRRHFPASCRDNDVRMQGKPEMTETLLFSPMTIRGVTLKNRIVVPPMHQYSAVKGFPTDWHLMNAGKFAAGGAGLVVVESTKVERRGCGTVGDLGIFRRTARPPCQIHQAAEFSRRHSARPFRPQHARDANARGRPPAAADL